MDRGIEIFARSSQGSLFGVRKRMSSGRSLRNEQVPAPFCFLLTLRRLINAA